MKRLLNAALLAAMLGMAPSAGAQEVVDFEGIPNFTLLTTEGGIDWSLGFWTSYCLTQPPYNPSSGSCRAYSSDSGFVTSFGFLGGPAQFGGAFFAGVSQDIYFNMYLNNALVGWSSTVVSSATPTFLNSGYGGLVDRVSVHSTGGNAFWVMDDVTYQTVSVPEPTTWMLMLTGVFGLGLVAWRRKREETA